MVPKCLVIPANSSTVILTNAIWRKKKSKVLELKDFETLERSVEKIEIFLIELKIATNFKRVNNNFPYYLLRALGLLKHAVIIVLQTANCL